MEQFEQQREQLRMKKMAEHQNELLRDMNKRDVDEILARHRKELAAIDETLALEQARQMEMMREKMKVRNAELAKTKGLRQLKMAEILVQREKEIDAVRRQAPSEKAEQEEQKVKTRETTVQRCVEKADLMQNLILKQCYSRPITHRRLL